MLFVRRRLAWTDLASVPQERRFRQRILHRQPAAWGPWVLAFTVAGTAISGGTFMGFPALIYSKGWIMALWISSYMVVPLTALVLLGKRLNQVSRMTGAVTVSDVFRDRFRSSTLGILSTLLVLGFLSVKSHRPVQSCGAGDEGGFASSGRGRSNCRFWGSRSIGATSTA